MAYDLLPIVQDNNSSLSVVVREVLSVALENSTPTIIVNSNGRSIPYRLPDEYFNWVENCESLVNYGVVLFPRQVSFGIVDGKYYVIMDTVDND